jgi:hypothetical protein
MAKLFISATTKGLKSYRIAAAAKLRELGHDVVVQDEFPMVPEKIAPMRCRHPADWPRVWCKAGGLAVQERLDCCEV